VEGASVEVGLLDSAAQVGLLDSAAQLLDCLAKVGASEQGAVLAERLPGAGLFAQFLKLADHKERFRFGRETRREPR